MSYIWFANTTVSSLTITGLTAQSVLFAGTGGLVSQDNTHFKYDDATDTLTIANLAVSSLTVTRVPFAGTGGLLSDSADLVFDSSLGKLTVGKIMATGGGAAANNSLIVNGAIEVYGTLEENNTTLHFAMGIGPGGDSARILFGHPSGNWEIDNAGGVFRWFTPGTVQMYMYPNTGANRIDFVSGKNLINVGGLSYNGSIAQTGTSINSFTGQVLTAATTTTRSGLTLPAGTAPTSPVDGDIWSDTTQKSLIAFKDGIKQSLVGCIFTQTADATVTNTVTETSIVGTGVGTLTLPANFFVAGKTIRLRIGGIYSTPALATPSIVIKVKYGATVIATVTTSALLSGATNLEFDGEVDITCRTTGSSGTVIVHGDIEYSTGVAGTIGVDSLNNSGATTTINTTTSNLLDVTVQWDTNTSTRSVKSTVTTVEVIN